MLTIARLFGRSPFAPLQTHMEKVACCLAELPFLFQAILEKNAETISLFVDKISKLKRDADRTKGDIRSQLPKNLFMPVQRDALLEILSLQDRLAHQAEIIAIYADMGQIPFFAEVPSEFSLFCKKVMEIFWLTRQVMKELEELLESAFGGIEAEKVKEMVEQMEHLAGEEAKYDRQLTKCLYQKGAQLPYAAFHLAHTLIQAMGGLVLICQELGNRIRKLVDLR